MTNSTAATPFWSLERRKAVLGIFLLAVTLWPLVQYALVRRYELNVWHFAAWGMYAAPRRAVLLEVSVREGERWRRWDAQHLEAAYRARRQSLGTLSEPVEVARAALASSPAAEAARVVVIEGRLQRWTGTIATGRTVYEYPREDGAFP